MRTEFIDWEKRRLGEDWFLLKNLKKLGCKEIFDACLGDGVDSIYLLKNWFKVTSNDLDEWFIKVALTNAYEHKVKLNVTMYDWRKLPSKQLKGQFDAVICLGNSLTYLLKKNDQIAALKWFFNLLRKKWILIIDERNYQYFLDNKAEILQGKFRYSGKYVYCWKTVTAKPTKITTNQVTMQYVHTKNNQKGSLVLYPFKKGELYALLKHAGFKQIELYSDYKKWYHPSADFYQYICLKW